MNVFYDSQLPEEIELLKIRDKIQNAQTSINRRENSIIEQKLLNNLINVYQHRYMNLLKKEEETERKKYIMQKEEKKLEILKPNFLPKIKSRGKSMPDLIKNLYPTPDFQRKKKQNQHEILEKVKIIQQAKKKKQALKFKNEMERLKNNLKIIRQNILQENRNKRNIVQIQQQIGLKKIDNYKIIRKKIVQLINEKEFNNFEKVNNSLKNKYKFWKIKCVNKSKELINNILGILNLMPKP